MLKKWKIIKKIGEREYNKEITSGNAKYRLEFPKLDCMKLYKGSKPEVIDRNGKKPKITKKKPEKPEKSTKESVIKIPDLNDDVNKETLESIKASLTKYDLKLDSDSLSFLVSEVLKNEKCKISLKYKLSKKKKNFEAKKFFKSIQNKKNLLVICRAETGQYFGGLIKTGWNMEDENFKKNCIFSLSKKTIHSQLRAINNKTALYSNENCGPTFGEKDLIIGNNCAKEATSKSELGDMFEFTGSNPTTCLLYTSPSPRDLSTSRMPSSA